MPRRSFAAPVRVGALVLTAAVLVGTSPGPGDALATLRALGSTPRATPDDAVAGLVAVTALGAQALLTWLALTATLTAGGRLSGRPGIVCRRVLRRIAPAALRRAAALVLGVGLVCGTAGPAAATGPAPGTPLSAGVPVSFDWPAQPSPAPAPATRSSDDAAPGAADRATPRPDPGRVVVVPGDTLWAIAEAHLPAGADAARVAAAWPAWWAANRDVIGTDPDLLRPGQRLRPPA